MKKRFAIFSAALLSVSLLAACGAPAASSSAAPSPAASSAAATAAPDASVPRTAFRIAGLKGPTTMGLVKLMDDVDTASARHDYAVTMHGTTDEIAPLLIKGELDVALVPANLASVLYNKTQGAIQVAAINSLGVLYVVSKDDTIQTVADLKGKTILSAGKGTMPEYVLTYILEQNGLTIGTDVQVEYYSEATEVAAAMQLAGDSAIAMLPQPYVTTLQMQMEGLQVVLDMTQEWDKISPESGLVTGVIVARKDFIAQNTAAFDAFLQDYAASAAFVNENVEAAAAMVVQRGIVPKEPIAQKAIPACNIVSITGADMKAKISGFLAVLHAQNAEAVGGALPQDDFYYGA